MEAKGKVHKVGATVQVTETVKKRELIVEIADNPQYPEYVKFEAIQDRCGIMDAIKVGDEVLVSFNLKGRPWTDKTGAEVYFNTLQVWKIERYGRIPAQNTANNDPGAYAPPAYNPPPAISGAPDGDDLPF
jgi:hypothetical protein